jgi:hypothetical protein
MWRFTLMLRTKTLLPAGTMVNDTDPAIRYSPGWQLVAQKNSRDFQGNYHLSGSPGATVEYGFEGTGLELWLERNKGSGSFDVLIDGAPAGSVNLRLESFPGLVQVPVFRAEGLSPGRHQVKIVSKGNGSIAFDAFRILP